MTYSIHFRSEAEADVEEAARWYERERRGLGGGFLDAVLMECDIIAEGPYLFPVLHRETRRKVMKRFPYGIFYRIVEQCIVVIAIMHDKRHPNRWEERE